MAPVVRGVTFALCGVILLVGVTSVWSQTWNPTASDANDNTAGGAGALINVDDTPTTGGVQNTAFGFEALTANSIGDANTAIGFGALKGNTTGAFNTAVGWAAQRGSITPTALQIQRLVNLHCF